MICYACGKDFELRMLFKEKYPINEDKQYICNKCVSDGKSQQRKVCDNCYRNPNCKESKGLEDTCDNHIFYDGRWDFPLTSL